MRHHYALPREVRDEEIRRLAADGLTSREISSMTGLARGTVKLYASRLGISLARGMPGRPNNIRTLPLRVSVETYRKVCKHADVHGFPSAETFAKFLLYLIARDNLFSAIIDDEREGGDTRGEEGKTGEANEAEGFKARTEGCDEKIGEARSAR